MNRISLALDNISLDKALDLVSQLGRWLRAVKLHDLLDRYGPVVIKRLIAHGAELPWIDYKLHDTKDTVAARVRALVENGAKIITVHASGGVPMMQEAVKATLDDANKPRAEIYAITVLTSLDDAEIKRIYGAERTREQIVHEFALMAYEAGVGTVVCSAQEVKMLKESKDLPSMRCAVPGTRSVGVALGQQKRSGTPEQAVSDGADELVAGSQVTKAEDSFVAFESMSIEIHEPLR
jgi:orotidine-5'-phosphate decarboxylase